MTLRLDVNRRGNGHKGDELTGRREDVLEGGDWLSIYTYKKELKVVLFINLRQFVRNGWTSVIHC